MILKRYNLHRLIKLFSPALFTSQHEQYSNIYQSNGKQFFYYIYYEKFKIRCKVAADVVARGEINDNPVTLFTIDDSGPTNSRAAGYDNLGTGHYTVNDNDTKLFLTNNGNIGNVTISINL